MPLGQVMMIMLMMMMMLLSVLLCSGERPSLRGRRRWSEGSRVFWRGRETWRRLSADTRQTHR